MCRCLLQGSQQQKQEKQQVVQQGNVEKEWEGLHKPPERGRHERVRAGRGSGCARARRRPRDST